MLKSMKLTVALLTSLLIILNATFGAGGSGHVYAAAAPFVVKITVNSDGSLTSTWPQAPDAVRYTLLLVDKKPSTGFAYAYERLTETAYTSIKSLPDGEVYKVIVTAYDSENTNIMSSAGEALIPLGFYKNVPPEIPYSSLVEPPSAPSSASSPTEVVKSPFAEFAESICATSGSTSITIRWDAFAGATGYDVLLDGKDAPVMYKVTGTSLTISDLSPNTRYTYAIRTDSSSKLGNYVSRLVMTLE